MQKLNASKKNRFIYRSMNAWKNYPRKTSLVAFLLSVSSCPIHAPVTILQTDSTTIISCECSENFWESVFGEITFQYIGRNFCIFATGENYNTCIGMSESQFFQKLGEVPFKPELQAYSLVCTATRNKLLPKFLNCALKLRKNVEKVISHGVHFQ